MLYSWWAFSVCVAFCDVTHSYLIHMCDANHSYVWCGYHMFCIPGEYFSYVWHDPFICTTWLTHTCDMTDSYIWLDPFPCVTWLVYTWDSNEVHVWRGDHMFYTSGKYSFHAWNDSAICVTWRIHLYEMIHSYMWHDSSMCVTRLIHMRDTTLSYVWCWCHVMCATGLRASCIWPDAFINVIPLIHVWGMPHSYVWQYSFICVTWLRHSFDMTQSYKWYDWFIYMWVIIPADMSRMLSYMYVCLFTYAISRRTHIFMQTYLQNKDIQYVDTV